MKDNDKNTFVLCLTQSTFAEIRKSHFHLYHFFKPSNHSKTALLTFESSAVQIKLSWITIISHQGFPTEKKKKSHNATYQNSKAEVLVRNIFRNKKDCRKHKQKIRKRMEWNGHMPPQQFHALQHTPHYSQMQFSLWEKKKRGGRVRGKSSWACSRLALLLTLRENCPHLLQWPRRN